MKRTEIELLLPGIFQRTNRPNSPLAALLEVMEAEHGPSEEALASLDAYFDPRRCPDRFVPYLAGWVDMDRFLPETQGEDTFPSGIGRLRELVAAAPNLARWRGTSKGLILFLETATGEKNFVVEEHVFGDTGRPKPFHIRVRAPQSAAPYQTLISRIIESEKPAYVTYELQIGDAPVNPHTVLPTTPPSAQSAAQPPKSNQTPTAAPVAPQTAPPAGAPDVPPVQPAPVKPPIQESPLTRVQPPPPAVQPELGSPAIPPVQSPQQKQPAAQATSPTAPIPVAPPIVLARLENLETGRSYPITTASVGVGRIDMATGIRPDIDLTDEDTARLVSRRHARIFSKNGVFYLTEEAGVANGTYVNGQRLPAQIMTQLHDGDQLIFGQLLLVFHSQ